MKSVTTLDFPDIEVSSKSNWSEVSIHVTCLDDRSGCDSRYLKEYGLDKTTLGFRYI